MSTLLSRWRSRIRLSFWFVYAWSAARLRAKRSHSALFLNYFVDEGTSAVSFGDRTLVPAAQRCVGCGLCTSSCSSIIQGKAPWGFDPSQIVLGLARSGADADVLSGEAIPCLQCDECVVHCPTRVPIHAIAAILVERSKRATA